MTIEPALSYGRPERLSEGPLAGWWSWVGQDPFETLLGPFAFRREEDGRIRAAFAPETRHLNAAGAVHGGCLMSFADFSLFAIADEPLQGAPAVTLACNCDFLRAGDLDGLIEAQGVVTRATGSLIFVQGQALQRGEAILAFSGILKRLKAR